MCELIDRDLLTRW